MTTLSSISIPRLARALGAAAILALGTATGAMAQGKQPSGPIDISVGASPGGSPDVIMRFVAKIMVEEGITDVPLVVQNRPGGSGSVSYNYVIGRPGDENLLLTLNQSSFTTPMMQGTEPIIDKVVPVANFIQSDLVFMVQPGAPYSTLTEFMEAAKAAPAQIRIAGALAGGTDHLATALLMLKGGVDLTYVPFDGGSVAISTFLGGNVEGVFATLEEGVPLITEGRAKPIAVLAGQRMNVEPYTNVPTAVEQGFDIVFGQSWGVALPPGTDPEVAVWWDDKLRKVVASQTWQDSIKAKMQQSEYYGVDRIAQRHEELNTLYGDLMRAVGLAK
ncbi:MAG: tripartite tricarboxylate transporter substrate binding protein [Paracoccaceae bacterium]|nr:MAG: tripartite tricarboxylate transporter substrate binding protein [Paracoccaceae bacterium]